MQPLRLPSDAHGSAALLLRHTGFAVSGQAAGGAFLFSASVTQSHCRQLAELYGWMASGGSHWAGDPDMTCKPPGNPGQQRCLYERMGFALIFKLPAHLGLRCWLFRKDLA